MRKLRLLPIPLALLLLALAPAPAMADRWTITVESLLPAIENRSQPLSPPGVAVHTGRVDVWSPGRFASRGVWSIAEDGFNDPLESALRGRRGVGYVGTPVEGIAPGQRRRFAVRASRRHDRITILEMLGNTNDGFTGLDAVRVPRGGRVVLETIAWDAGSERNNEAREFVPGPCCGSRFARDPERRRIRRHPGIAGRGVLVPAEHGWSGAVARYTVRRSRR